VIRSATDGAGAVQHTPPVKKCRFFRGSFAGGLPAEWACVGGTWNSSWVNICFSTTVSCSRFTMSSCPPQPKFFSCFSSRFFLLDLLDAFATYASPFCSNLAAVTPITCVGRQA
jgi:hypothetical protein